MMESVGFLGVTFVLETVAMLSKSNSFGTPPNFLKLLISPLATSSNLFCAVISRWAYLEYFSVVCRTFITNFSPYMLVMLISSFQSTCACSPGFFSNLGCPCVLALGFSLLTVTYLLKFEYEPIRFTPYFFNMN